MERKVTFIFGTGRCGSTLAQRLINASPDAVIWGEHDGFLKHIAAGYFGVLKSENVIKNVFQQPGRYSDIHLDKERICQSQVSWMNDFDEASLKSYFTGFIEKIFSGKLHSSVSCWGFKEIRYGFDSNDLSIDMLMELFPESRNLIITRHPFDTVISMLTAWNKSIINQAEQNYNSETIAKLALKHSRKWATQNQNLIAYLNRFPDNFLCLRYEDFREKFNTAVFDFMEIEPPDRVEHVFNKNHSRTQKTSNSHLLREYLHNIQSDIWKIVEKTALDLGYQPYELNKSGKDLVKS